DADAQERQAGSEFLLQRRTQPDAVKRAVALLVLCTLAGCGGDPGSKAVPPRESVAPGDLSCASSEAAWQRALDEASAAKCAGGLEERAGALASSCPERWEAPWILGECRMLRDDRKG